MERVPELVGWITLGAGASLVVAPQRVTEPLGLQGQETAMRAMGVADLVLVPGLLRGRPRWPWMIGRAALNVAQAAYLRSVAPRSSAPALARGGAAALLALTAVDGATGLALRRAGA